MPNAHYGLQCQVSAKSVVRLIAVDWADKADKRVGCTWEWLGGQGFGILNSRKIQGEVQPFVGRIENDAMGVSRL